MAWQSRGAPDPQQLGNQQTMYQNYPGVTNMNPNMQQQQQQQQQYWQPGQGGTQPQYGHQSSETSSNNANQYYPQYNQNYNNQGYNPNAVNYQHNYYQNPPQQQQSYRKQQDGWEDNWDWGWDETKQAQFVAQQAISTASHVPTAACNNANVIEDSFNTTDTWNWSLEDKSEGNKQSAVPPPKDASNSDNNSHRRSSLAPLSEESNVRSLEDRDAVKEHHPNLALGKRFHLDNLTPQWSIESQMSQDSSDGPHTHSESTYRSDNQSRNSSKSSPGFNTEASNFNYSQSVIEEASLQNTEWSRHSTEDSTTLDNISQSFVQHPDAINEELLPHMQDLHISNRENLQNNINQQVQVGSEHDSEIDPVPKLSSTSQPPPNLPVPQHYPMTSSPTNVPPPTTFPSMPAQNPFKNPNSFTHKTSTKSSITIPKEVHSQIPSGALSSPSVVNKISQQQDRSVLGYHTANLETTPDNSEQPDQPQTSTYRSIPVSQQLPDNLEVAPKSDRNEYLQTAHLSNSEYVENTDFGRHVPPPGLRRMVVGQQEPEFNQTLNLSTDEPPPGLARMVPGQQTENDISFSQSGENFMDRLIDGQPTQDSQRNPFRQADGQQTPDVYAQSSTRTDRRPIGIDRMVPGESSNDDYNRSQQYQTVGYASNEERVVTGLDHSYGASVDVGNPDVREQNMDGSDYCSNTTRTHRGARDVTSDTTSVPLSGQPDQDQQRELIMEGENLQDLSIISSAELSFSREHIVGGSDTNLIDASTVKTDISDSLEMHSNNSRRHSINRVNTSGEESERDRALKGSPRRDGRKLSGEQDTDKDRYGRDDRRFDRHTDRRRGDKRSEKESRRGERTRRSREQSPEDRRARRSARSRRYDTEDTDYYSDRERERRRYREGSYTTSKPPRPDDKDRRYRDERERNRRYATIERERRYDLDERDGASRRRGEREEDRYERKYRDIDPGNKYGNVRRERRDTGRRGTDRDSGESGGGDDAVGERDERRRTRGAARGARPREHYYDAYVQQYQYYEHLRRHDPAAYTHLYHTLMSGRGAPAPVPAPAAMYPDGPSGGADSVHSGRSSGNNFTINTEFNTDGSLNLHLDESTVRSERMTPFKYSTAHIKGAASSPHMVLLQPSYPADGRPAAVQVLDLGTLLAHDRLARGLARFPGPLVLGLTHKPTVVDYCRERSQQAARAAPHDPAGYALIWDLLALLLRQNGVAMGSDLAELLLNNQREYETKLAGADRRTDSRSGSALSSRSRSPDPRPQSHPDPSPTSAVSERAALDKYREYLEMGNVQQALEWAVANCLWAHALQLAAWCGPRARAHVAARFLAALPSTDTLHTLYSQRAARAPPAVTAVLSDKWGDWRPHLAIMLANPSSKPDLDRKSIVQMGDSLQARGLPLSAQFCYVSGELEFSRHPLAPLTPPSERAAVQPRLSLLLAPPAPVRLSQLAHDEALFATSIYEYARSLHAPFVLESFQVYKLVLAARLVDAGLPERALLCTELLARELSARPALYPPALLRLTADLADRLRHYEPALPAALPGELPDDADSAHSSPTRHLRWIEDIQAAAQTRTADQPQQQVPVTPFVPQYWSQPTANSPEPPPHSPSPVPPPASQQNHHQPQPPPEQVYSWSPEQSPQQYLQPVPVMPAVSPEEERHYWQEDSATYYGEDSSAGPHPGTISMPGAPSAVRPALYDDYDDEPRPQTQQENSPGGTAEESDKKGEEGRGKGGAGWFGGIFNKLSLRPPNQMILPDDKNPSIVWDADNKRWRNLDCEEEETAGPPPPPPCVSTAALQQQQFDPSSPLAPPAAPLSNIFKMQKSRHIKRSYVDVFNQGAASARAPPASEVLPPAPPPLSAGHAYFVPQQSSEVEEMAPSSM